MKGYRYGLFAEREEEEDRGKVRALDKISEISGTELRWGDYHSLAEQGLCCFLVLLLQVLPFVFGQWLNLNVQFFYFFGSLIII